MKCPKQNEFLEKYGVDPAAFKAAAIEWRELETIFNDHVSRLQELHLTGAYIADRLRQLPAVHSLKFRVKDPEHLLEKVIRKRAADMTGSIGADNYKERVTDIVGVRALHLFKDEWPMIHDAIMGAWELNEPPVANVRKGDPDEVVQVFKEKGCAINEHRFGYRSVHYIVKSQPSRDLVLAELQVRTIFEEGWSEIDHRMRYPYDLDNVILSQFLVIFNRLAGSADEMGSFIRFLKSQLETRESEYASSIATYEAVVRDLTSQIEKLEITKKEKEALELRLKELSSAATETWRESSSARLSTLLDSERLTQAQRYSAAQRLRLLLGSVPDEEVRAARERLLKVIEEAAPRPPKPKK